MYCSRSEPTSGRYRCLRIFPRSQRDSGGHWKKFRPRCASTRTKSRSASHSLRISRVSAGNDSVGSNDDTGTHAAACLTLAFLAFFKRKRFMADKEGGAVETTPTTERWLDY